MRDCQDPNYIGLFQTAGKMTRHIRNDHQKNISQEMNHPLIRQVARVG